MTPFADQGGSAIRRFREALAELGNDASAPRQRLINALAALEPVITNTTGLTASERERFRRILHRTSAYLDLDHWDLGRGIMNAPADWVTAVTLELVGLLEDVVERAGDAWIIGGGDGVEAER